MKTTYQPQEESFQDDGTHHDLQVTDDNKNNHDSISPTSKQKADGPSIMTSSSSSSRKDTNKPWKNQPPKQSTTINLNSNRNRNHRATKATTTTHDERSRNDDSTIDNTEEEEFPGAVAVSQGGQHSRRQKGRLTHISENTAREEDWSTVEQPSSDENAQMISMMKGIQPDEPVPTETGTTSDRSMRTALLLLVAVAIVAAVCVLSVVLTKSPSRHKSIHVASPTASPSNPIPRSNFSFLIESAANVNGTLASEIQLGTF